MFFSQGKTARDNRHIAIMQYRSSQQQSACQQVQQPGNNHRQAEKLCLQLNGISEHFLQKKAESEEKGTNCSYISWRKNKGVLLKFACLITVFDMVQVLYYKYIWVA